MIDTKTPGTIAVSAEAVPPRTEPTNYPEPFSRCLAGRQKRQLGDVFGLRNFGVNLTKLVPGGESALLHRHSKQDEFVFILEGNPSLVTETEETVLGPGMCAGFPAQGVAHQLVNRTAKEVAFLEIGDRISGDKGSYPNDDIEVVLGDEGEWMFAHKDGRPY